MFLLKKFRFKTLGTIIFVLLAVVMVMSMLDDSNYGDDVSNYGDDVRMVEEKESNEAADATPSSLSDVIISHTLSEVNVLC